MGRLKCEVKVEGIKLSPKLTHYLIFLHFVTRLDSDNAILIRVNSEIKVIPFVIWFYNKSGCRIPTTVKIPPMGESLLAINSIFSDFLGFNYCFVILDVRHQRTRQAPTLLQPVLLHIQNQHSAKTKLLQPVAAQSFVPRAEGNLSAHIANPKTPNSKDDFLVFNSSTRPTKNNRSRIGFHSTNLPRKSKNPTSPVNKGFSALFAVSMAQKIRLFLSCCTGLCK